MNTGLDLRWHTEPMACRLVACRFWAKYRMLPRQEETPAGRDSALVALSFLKMRSMQAAFENALSRGDVEECRRLAGRGKRLLRRMEGVLAYTRGDDGGDSPL